ncbi:hypothetical protein WJX73_003132 [Symbiochloris irregularis]|uniref:Histone-binding protein RBBP4-like N-terminal domain-containing protein n=1 Tax=Symbiochloris irregularis TaxID=706552 RepID=A0AAW1Q2E7_9CHLO
MAELATYKAWKSSIPMLYDWFANHHLAWPSLCCRWGGPISHATYKDTQHLYLSERTDNSESNLLIVAAAEVIKPRVAAAEQIINFKESEGSHHIKIKKSILHPGEVNKIRELPKHSHFVVTHTDAKELYLWNTETQPAYIPPKPDVAPVLATPDLILEGHEANAQFALGCSTAAPCVASGGQDANVLVWNIEDYNAGSVLSGQPGGAAGPRLPNRNKLEGHTATVEDVGFKPRSSVELVSVGDDHALLVWDTRSGSKAVLRVDKAHGDNDLHCVDWCGKDTHYLATGAADGSVKVWDKRRLGVNHGPLHTFTLHRQATMRVEWAPWQSGVLASGGEDGRVCVWDIHKSAPPEGESLPPSSRLPPQLLFQHMGHRAQVVDFQWHPSDHFTMVSVSEHDAGGTLQLWRINDLITMPEEQALAELEKHREFILDDAAAAQPMDTT